MWRYILLIVAFMCLGSSGFTQQNGPKPDAGKDLSRMVLRANTRDKIMIVRNNKHQRLLQQRRKEMVKMNQMHMQRRMQMNHKRRMIRLQQIRKQRIQQQRVRRMIHQHRSGGAR